jgi:hypothetical protein
MIHKIAILPRKRRREFAVKFQTAGVRLYTYLSDHLAQNLTFALHVEFRHIVYRLGSVSN